MKSANELIGPLALFENHLPTLPFFTPFSHWEVKVDDHGQRPPCLDKVRAKEPKGKRMTMAASFPPQHGHLPPFLLEEGGHGP